MRVAMQGVAQRLPRMARSTVRHRALPAVVGAVAVWVGVAIVGDGSVFGTLQSGATVGAFVALTGLGQLFVIAAGNGNIDLSVPSVLTLSAYVASGLVNGNNAAIVPAVLAVVGIGAAIGVVNATLILVLDLPPIVGTLAVGFILETIYLEISPHVQGGVGSFVGTLATGRVVGVPYMAIIVIVLAGFVAVVLTRSWFGRQVLALGQSRPAAELAGVRSRLIIVATYVICGITAALAGVLLAGYVGGASPDIAASYQLGSIAVVVLGGCLIAGGVANSPGVLAASLFITLLVTFTNLLHVSAGIQQIIEGGIIVLLLSTVGKDRVRVS